MDRLRQLLYKMCTQRTDTGVRCSVPEIWELRDGIHMLEDDIDGYSATAPPCVYAWLNGSLKFRNLVQPDLIVNILKPYEDDPLCASRLGQVYYKQSLYKQAVVCWQRAASAGCAEGICQLANAYKWGVAIEEDREKAYNLFYKAATMKHPTAVSQVAECLWYGLGVPMDKERAIQYFTESSAMGISCSLRFVANRFCDATGVPLDLRRAAHFYRLAILDGDDVDFCRDAMRSVQWRDPDAVIPYGEWRPNRIFHAWVSNDIHHQMRTVLLMHAQSSSEPKGLFSTLPRVLLPNICFWICTK